MRDRQNHRFRMGLPGRLIVNARPEIRVVTRDLSLRGASLECLDHGLREQERAILVLQAEHDALLSLTLVGRVAYVRRGVCGVTFDAVHVEDFADLYRLLGRQPRHRSTIDGEIENGFVPDLQQWDLRATDRITP